ncbi:hypothetical protein B1B_01081, partial [mine drainage metagenome]
GEVLNILSQLSESLGPEYDKLLEQIRDAPSRHMDTTSWRVNGENHDLWTFVTKTEAIFRITKSNNHEVPLAVLGTIRGRTFMTGTAHSRPSQRRRAMTSSTAGYTSYVMQRNWNGSTVKKAGS